MKRRNHSRTFTNPFLLETLPNMSRQVIIIHLDIDKEARLYECLRFKEHYKHLYVNIRSPLTWNIAQQSNSNR